MGGESIEDEGSYRKEGSWWTGFTREIALIRIF